MVIRGARGAVAVVIGCRCILCTTRENARCGYYRGAVVNLRIPNELEHLEVIRMGFNARFKVIALDELADLAPCRTKPSKEYQKVCELGSQRASATCTCNRMFSTREWKEK